MKKILFFAAVAALSAMVSCQKEEAPSQKEAKPIVFSASIAAPSDTKVSVDVSDGKVSWVEGDEITITDGTDTGVYTAKSAGATTDFKYSSGKEFTESGNYSATYGTMPTAGVDQAYSTTAGELIYMTAQSTSTSATTANFTFTAKCGLLKLNLINADYSVSRISVTSTDGDTYTLTCSEPQSISTAKDFYIALPKGEYNKYVIYPSSGSYAAVKTAKTGKETSIAANQINKVTFSSLTFATPIYPESNTVGIKINGIYWAPVNCGYDATDYLCGKLYQWGRMDGCGYYKDKVIIPASDASDKVIQTTIVNLEQSAYTTSSPDASSFYSNPNTGTYDWYTSTTGSQFSEWPMTAPSGTSRIGNPCPAGWRVPSSDELGNLVYSDWDSTTQCGTLKNTYSFSSGYGTINGLTFPAAGLRYYTGGYFFDRSTQGLYWSSSSSLVSHFAMGLTFDQTHAIIQSYARAYGYSIRCVKDNIGINSMDEDGNSVID